MASRKARRAEKREARAVSKYEIPTDTGPRNYELLRDASGRAHTAFHGTTAEIQGSEIIAPRLSGAQFRKGPMPDVPHASPEVSAALTARGHRERFDNAFAHPSERGAWRWAMEGADLGARSKVLEVGIPKHASTQTAWNLARGGREIVAPRMPIKTQHDIPPPAANEPHQGTFPVDFRVHHKDAPLVGSMHPQEHFEFNRQVNFPHASEVLHGRQFDLGAGRSEGLGLTYSRRSKPVGPVVEDHPPSSGQGTLDFPITPMMGHPPAFI